MAGQAAAEPAGVTATAIDPAVPDVGTAPGPGASGHSDRTLRLAELIWTRSLPVGSEPGGRLPTERQLAGELGETRSSIRHALAIMAARGLITREVGRGTFVRAPEAAPAGGSTGGSTGGEFAPAGGTPGGAFAPADVMTIRRLLEPPAMSLAVAWATAADFAEMDRCLSGGDRASSFEDFESWDLALHRAIVAASHSPLLVALYQVIETARHGHVWGDLKRRSASAERRQQYQADHHELVAAVKSRHPARAVEAMRRHLARVSDHLNATDPAAALWT